MKKIRHLLPGTLKEILGHVPEIAFDMVDWFQLINTINPILRRAVTHEGFDSLKGSTTQQFSKLGILYDGEGDILSELKVHERQIVGEKILRLFFTQIYSKDGCFIDLRPHHFVFDKKHLYFNPSGMWIKWNPDFQLGLIRLYRGFYYENSEDFEAALVALNLVQTDWDQKLKDELKNILKEQFARGIKEPTYFELEQFHQSFMKLFNFLLLHKTKLKSDFIVLGAYLVSLYLCLELLGTSHQVKDIFIEIDKEFK